MGEPIKRPPGIGFESIDCGGGAGWQPSGDCAVTTLAKATNAQAFWGKGPLAAAGGSCGKEEEEEGKQDSVS